MSDTPTLNSSTANFPIHADHIVATEADQNKPATLEKQRIITLSHELQRIYTWLGALAGSSVILAATLTGLIIWLKQGQQQLEQQVSSLAAAKAETNRVKTLETQVNLLNQRVPKELTSQIKGTQTQLKKLQAGLDQVNAKAVTREEMNEKFSDTLKGINQKPNSPAR